MRVILNVLKVVTIVFLLNASCQNNIKDNENVVWRLINPDTLSLDEAFWLDFYKVDAVGPKFWQLEFIDTVLIEHRSHGFNVLHKSKIEFKIDRDTLMLFYPRGYVFNHFEKTGSFMRLHTEKWLMQENNDTLILTLASIKDAFSNKGKFMDVSTVYRFVKPTDERLFPDYLAHAPKNKKDIIDIMNNLYSEKGKAELIDHFNSIPDEDDRGSFGIRRSIIFSDLNNLFTIQDNPVLQELFNHYHPEVVTGMAIGVYLDYLKHGETYINGDE